MTQNIDLKQIERKTYMAFHQDGIWDLCVGLAMMGVAIDVLLGGSGASIVVLAGAIAMVPMIKKAVVSPRLGYVKFSPKREEREKLNFFAMSILLTSTALIGGLVAYAYSGDAAWQLWIRNLEAIPFGIVIASVAAALGLLWGVKRCWFYSALTLVVFITGHLNHWRINVNFGILGVVLVSVGLFLLVNFIRKYPRRPGEANHGI